MLSVFRLHDRARFKVYLYTTSPWDGTSYRPRISREVEMFVDASSWSSQQIVEHIAEHRIHVRECTPPTEMEIRSLYKYSCEPWWLHQRSKERCFRCSPLPRTNTAHGVCWNSRCRYDETRCKGQGHQTLTSLCQVGVIISCVTQLLALESCQAPNSGV